jgi:hypothetical protein
MDDEPNDRTISHDNFLYLLAEMEQALERGVKWPPGAQDQAIQRVIRILGAMARETGR